MLSLEHWELDSLRTKSIRIKVMCNQGAAAKLFLNECSIMNVELCIALHMSTLSPSLTPKLSAPLSPVLSPINDG